MKKDEELKQMVEEEFYSTSAKSEIEISPRHYLMNRLIRLWYMVIELKNHIGGLDKSDRIEPLTIGKKFLSVGSPFYEEVPPNGVEMTNKINEIIERLNRVQGKEKEK